MDRTGHAFVLTKSMLMIDVLTNEHTKTHLGPMSCHFTKQTLDMDGINH